LARAVNATDATTQSRMVRTAKAVLQDGTGATKAALDAILQRL